MKIPRFIKDNVKEFVAGGAALAVCLIVGLSVSGDALLGAVPSSAGFPGIYNATTTGLVLRDGYGSALATDRNGRVIISPSSTWTNFAITYVSSTAIDATGYVSSSKIIAGGGSAAAPSYSFLGDSDTGIYEVGGGQIRMSSNGQVVFSVDSGYGISVGRSGAYSVSVAGTGGLKVPSGNDAVPPLGDVTHRWSQLFTATGTSAAPAISLGSLGTQGFYMSSLGTMGLTTSLVPSTNNSKDLGSNTGSWRRIYASSTSYIASANMLDSAAATTTLRIGGAAKKGCFAIEDVDGAGFSYCTTLNGTMTCSMTACN